MGVDGLAGWGAEPLYPGFGLHRLSRQALATLGREWLLHGHLHDRAGMPLYLAEAGREEMEQLAVDEWMLASPVYSRRMQKALRFAGDGVDTIFKNIQLDIGAPHQFMDFRYRVHDHDHGEFWLDHCGALMDVEPLGEEFVVGMCHHIEDPTFDATAAATNVRAQVRPLHRPPRRPADRHPHCHWTVVIDPTAAPAAPHPRLRVMEESPLASLPVAPVPGAGVSGAGVSGAGSGGWADYSGPFDPDFVLERLSRPALVTALGEFALQAHLLARAYLLSLSERVGDDRAVSMAHRVLTAQAAMTARRLVSAARLEGGAGGALAKLFQIHPLLHPAGLLEVQLEPVDRGLGIQLAPRLPPDPYGWLACVETHGPAPIETIAQAVDPRARCVSCALDSGGNLSVEVVVDPEAEPAPPPAELALIELSTGAAFQFRQPLPAVTARRAR